MHSALRAWMPARREIRRTVAASVFALLFMVPSALADTGDLTAGGCFRDVENGATGCTSAQGLDRGYGVAVSADGRSVYVASADDDTLTTFARNPDTGALSWSACLRDNTRSAIGCTSVPGLDGARGVALSSDDANVYVASGEGDALAAFARDKATGALAPIGCLRDPESTVAGCTAAQGLDDPRDVAVSPDGASVYLASATDDAVVAFSRAPDGRLSFRSCIRWGGNGGSGCATAAGMDGPRGVAVSPDGTGVYVASRDGDAVVSYRRAVDGSLTWTGCFRDADLAAGSCTSAQGLDGPHGVTVSPDGASVYFPSESDDAVVSFRRDASGTLAYAGCLRDAATAANGCTSVEGLDGARQVDVSPDNRSVYVAAADDDAVATFRRDTGTGALTWVRCVRDAERGTAGCASTAQGLDGVRGVVASPDGKSVYAASEIDDTVVAFAREGAPAPPPPPPADTAAPALGWTAPAAGATLSGTVACAVDATDDVGVARVDFQLDGQPLGSDSSAPFDCTWDTTQTPDGGHTLTATAYDAAGNHSAATRSVTVANAPPPPPPPPPPPTNQAPTVSLTSPLDGDLLAEKVTFTATASDDERVVLVEFYLGGAKRVSDSAAPYKANWNSKGLAPGYYQVVARAYDAQGLSTSSAIVTIRKK